MTAWGSYGAMVLVQLAYGGSNILMKIALEKGLNQLVFVVYRHIIAMLLLGPFAYVLERYVIPFICHSFCLDAPILRGKCICQIGSNAHHSHFQ